MPSATKIESRVQLLVEGNDQRNFFDGLVEHLSFKGIQIQNFGGVTELRGFLGAFVNMPGFHETVDSVGIVRDAETSAEGAFQSVQSSLLNAKLPVPHRPEERAGTDPMVTAMILPSADRDGMLETLLCETFAGTPVDRCIDDFFACAAALPGTSIERRSKARAHAFLATKPKPHLSVGVAAKNGYWDLNHAAFSRIRDFVKMIATILPAS